MLVKPVFSKISPNMPAKNTIPSAWEYLLKLVWENGQEIKDERGDTVKVLYNVGVKINYPDTNPVVKCHPYAGNMGEYAGQILNGAEGFEYTYHDRMFKWNPIPWIAFSGPGFVMKGSTELTGVDQIDYVIRTLKSSRKSRRAVLTTMVPSIDTNKTEIPCLQQIKYFILDGYLHVTQLWRSRDLFGAWPVNMYGLLKLHEKVVYEIGDVKLGTITDFSEDLHIIWHNWGEVKEILKNCSY